MAYFKELKPVVEFTNGNSDTLNLVANGQVVVATVWEDMVFDFIGRGLLPPQIKARLLTEGEVGDGDGAMIPSGATNLAGALLFMDYLMSDDDPALQAQRQRLALGAHQARHRRRRSRRRWSIGSSRRTSTTSSPVRASSAPSPTRRASASSARSFRAAEFRKVPRSRQVLLGGGLFSTASLPVPGIRAMARVRLNALRKTFGETVAVDHFDLDVADGEFVALLGPSGCGKTTVLRMIAGIAQPDERRDSFGDRRVDGLAPERRNVGLVFQSYALFPHMSVAANVGFGLRMRQPRAHRTSARSVAEALALVDLAAMGARYPRELSGGQQQRVALARALVIEPDVLLLDEPLSNLDAKLREHLREDIRALQRRLAHDRHLRHPRPVRGDGARRPRRPDECRPHRRNRARRATSIACPAIASPPSSSATPTSCTARPSRAGCAFPGAASSASRTASAGDVLLSVRPEDIRLRTRRRGPGSGQST